MAGLFAINKEDLKRLKYLISFTHVATVGFENFETLDKGMVLMCIT
jgi:hypothetical protein